MFAHQRRVYPTSAPTLTAQRIAPARAYPTRGAIRPDATLCDHASMSSPDGGQFDPKRRFVFPYRVLLRDGEHDQELDPEYLPIVVDVGNQLEIDGREWTVVAVLDEREFVPTEWEHEQDPSIRCGTIIAEPYVRPTLGWPRRVLDRLLGRRPAITPAGEHGPSIRINLRD
jgi:hypothetical protein